MVIWHFQFLKLTKKEPVNNVADEMSVKDSALPEDQRSAERMI